MDFAAMQKTVMTTMTEVGFRVIGAIVLWIVGRWLIGFAVRIISAGLVRQHIDATLQNYMRSAVTGLLNIILIVSILGSFGVQTTTFAAVLAAMGLAIGTAWGGLLAHFAAGVFLVILRPFKLGDFITVGGVTGTVAEMGPFATKIVTPDNVMTIVSNNKVFSDNIQNYTTNPYRRVELFAQLNHDADVPDAVLTLKAKLAAIPNVLKTPAPDVEILEFSLNGPKLAVRPYCHNDHYWQVYFDTNDAIRATCLERGYSAPEQHFVVRSNA